MTTDEYKVMRGILPNDAFIVIVVLTADPNTQTTWSVPVTDAVMLADRKVSMELIEDSIVDAESQVRNRWEISPSNATRNVPLQWLLVQSQVIDC